MNMTNAIVNYRRHLKRRNYSEHTVKGYMNKLKHFVLWIDVPIESVHHKKMTQYIDYLLDKGLQPKSINSHLDSIRGFYNYLRDEEEVLIDNPVKRGYALRLSRPLFSGSIPGCIFSIKPFEKALIISSFRILAPKIMPMSKPSSDIIPLHSSELCFTT